MTTTTSPPRGRNLRVLLVAGGCVAAALAIATLVGGLADGSQGALGALAGGGITFALLVFGLTTVIAGSRLAPHASMLIALMTFLLQVGLVAIVFVALGSSVLVGTTLSSGWLAAGVIVTAVAWMVGHLVGTARSRIPAWDVELPGPTGGPSSSREVPAP
jgi:ATP synthase protein I